MIERILILRIPEIAKDVLGVAGELLEVEQFVESQLLDEPFLILLRYLDLDLMIEVEFVLLLLLLLLQFLGVRQHGARDGDAVLNGVAAEEGE